MADRFDQVTKAIASGQLTRRQALRRVGIGAGVGLLALVGGSRTAFASPTCGAPNDTCGGSAPPCCSGKCTGTTSGICR